MDSRASFAPSAREVKTGSATVGGDASLLDAKRATVERMWRPVDEPWQYRVLAAMPPSIDIEQIKRARQMTTTERILAMMKVVEAAEALRRGIKR